MSNSEVIKKLVINIPAEQITPNTIYFLRRGLGFDIAISDEDGTNIQWLNSTKDIWNNTIVPAHHKIPHNLSVIVPYMFNTRASSTTWNTGFAKILDSIKKYKALKFYVLLDLYNLSALTLERAVEAVKVITGMGGVPLAYYNDSNTDLSGGTITNIVNTLTTRYGRDVGLFLHAPSGMTDYTYSVFSQVMGSNFLYPLVVYTGNTQAISDVLFDHSHGDIYIHHIDYNGTTDTLYDVLSLYEYQSRGAFIYGVSEANISLALNKYNTTGTIFITNLSTPNNIITSTLPTYYETLISELNKYYTQDIINTTLVTQAEMTGIVSYFAHTNITGRWLLANGAAISRSIYSALFAKIGTTYGAGNGSTTFNLPDIRGIFIRGLDGGRGYDTGRILGSLQTDGVAPHSHLGGSLIQNAGNPNYGAIETVRVNNNRYVRLNSASSYAYYQLHYTVDNGPNAPIPLVDNTRPINIALYPCIYY